MPVLESVKDWAPFKLDALGIIALLAADSLRQSISRLVPNGIAEYLPLLAAQIIADNTITNGVPGFALYNITDGVFATDLSAWWTRWLTCQKLNWNTTTLHVNALPQRRPLLTIRWAAMLFFNVAIDAALIVIPVLLGDWYGFAASVGLVVTVLARAYILSSLRQAIDYLVVEAENQKDPVTLFLTLPNGRAVTVLTTRGLTTNVLLTEARPRNNALYLLFRAIDWIAFGVLVVCLGSACLCMQIIIIVTLLLATVLVVRRFGCNEYHIGRRLEIVEANPDGDDSRHNAYLRLNLSKDQEGAMISWHLLPMKFNTFWWDRYRSRQGVIRKSSDPEGSAKTPQDRRAPV